MTGQWILLLRGTDGYCEDEHQGSQSVQDLICTLQHLCATWRQVDLLEEWLYVNTYGLGSGPSEWFKWRWYYSKLQVSTWHDRGGCKVWKAVVGEDHGWMRELG